MQTHGWVVRMRVVSDSGGSLLRQSIELKHPVDEKWTEWKTLSSEVGSFAAIVEMLGYFDLTRGLCLDRTRRVAEVGVLRLCLDDVKMLGAFLEVESAQPLDDADIRGLVRELVPEGTEARPYGEILLKRVTEDVSMHQENARLFESVLHQYSARG
jgi:adenylate cyclase class IV